MSMSSFHHLPLINTPSPFLLHTNTPYHNREAELALENRASYLASSVIATRRPPAMAAHVDPLVVGRVIGDVVDMFVPTMAVSVRFGTKDLTNGCEIKPSVAADAPTVQVAGRVGDLFTLVRIHRMHVFHVSVCQDVMVVNYSGMYTLNPVLEVTVNWRVLFRDRKSVV